MLQNFFSNNMKFLGVLGAAVVVLALVHGHPIGDIDTRSTAIDLSKYGLTTRKVFMTTRRPAVITDWVAITMRVAKTTRKGLPSTTPIPTEGAHGERDTLDIFKYWLTTRKISMTTQKTNVVKDNVAIATTPNPPLHEVLLNQVVTLKPDQDIKLYPICADENESNDQGNVTIPKLLCIVLPCFICQNKSLKMIQRTVSVKIINMYKS